MGVSEMRTLRFGGIAFLLTLATLASSAAALEVPSEKTTWLSLRTQHFLVVSDTGRGKVRDTAVDLERLVTAIRRIAPHLAWTPLPTEAVMFSSNARFEEYCTAAAGKSCQGVAGIYLSGRHGNYLLISGGHFNDARAIACHELTHSIVHNSSPDIPLWLNEGFAEIYGSTSPVGDDILIGRPEEEHLAVLRERGFMPVAEILSVGYDSPEYNQDNLRPVFYAESWLMTHYMLVGAARTKSHLPEYLARIGRGEDREQAFRAAFGVSTVDFTKELHAYAQEHRMYALRLAGADLALPPIPEARPLPRDEALSVLAEPLLDAPGHNAAAAEAFLAQARRANPGSALATSLLASAMCRDGKEEEALPLFEEAVRSPSPSALPPLLYAEHLLEGPTPEPARARELLKAALAAEPDNLAALTAFGMVCVTSPGADLERAIQALERALLLAPSRGDAGANLSQLLAQAGRFDRAVAVVRRYVTTSPEASIRSMAPDLLVRIYLEAAETAASQGRLDEAARTLETGLAALSAPNAQARVRQRLKQIRDTRDYNAAVELARNGDNAGALAALDTLLPTVEDPALRRTAETFKSSLAGRNAPGGSGAVEEDRGWLASEHDMAVRRQIAEQREADRYNEAVALANKGKLKAATAIADELAKKATNKTVREAAVGLASRLRARPDAYRP